ncbi:MAG TPA: 5-oxoprolinase subunit PxpB [Chitinophagaceae bacterium]
MGFNAPAYHIFPLGDTALTIDYGNSIDENINKEVIARTQQLKDNLKGVIEIVPAYSSLTVYYDLAALKRKTPKDKLVYEHLKQTVEQWLEQPLLQQETAERQIKIPVCYDPVFATDILAVAKANNITVEEVMAIHLSRTYRVFMLGFLPGFSYMGEIDERIAMPRKPQPEMVAPGSVAIAGKQTGIYPLASPGGWRIIGRTPVKLFDAEDKEPTLLRAGDRVQFISITRNDFYELENDPLRQENG